MCWDEHQAFLRDGQGYLHNRRRRLKLGPPLAPLALQLEGLLLLDCT